MNVCWSSEQLEFTGGFCCEAAESDQRLLLCFWESYKILVTDVLTPLREQTHGSGHALSGCKRRDTQSYKLHSVSFFHKRENPKTSFKIDQSEFIQAKIQRNETQFGRHETITADKCLPVKLEVMNLISFSALLRNEKVNGGRVAKYTTRLRRY